MLLSWRRPCGTQSEINGVCEGKTNKQSVSITADARGLMESRPWLFSSWWAQVFQLPKGKKKTQIFSFKTSLQGLSETVFSQPRTVLSLTVVSFRACGCCWHQPRLLPGAVPFRLSIAFRWFVFMPSVSSGFVLPWAALHSFGHPCVMVNWQRFLTIIHNVAWCAPRIASVQKNKIQ